jgi:polyhydroxyalkanoate synthesis regulator phasin
MEQRTERGTQEQLDELTREFNVRQRCFDRWVKEGRMTATDAQDRLDRLGSAVKTVQKVHDLNQPAAS